MGRAILESGQRARHLPCNSAHLTYRAPGTALAVGDGVHSSLPPALACATAALAVAFAVAPAAVAAAEPSRPLPLGAAIGEAVRNSPALGMSIADYRSAEGAVLAAKGLDDPILDGTGLFTETHQVASSPVQPGTVDDLQLAVALTQPLPTGGRIGLKLGNEYTREALTGTPTVGLGSTLTAASAVGTPLTLWQPTLQLTFTHSLLRGFGVDVARAPQHKARVLLEAAGSVRGATAAALLRDVIAGYWELYFAQHQLVVRRVLADAAREQLRVVLANIDVGKQQPSASAEVEVAIAARDTDALAAEQELLERAVELARLMGHEIDAAAAQLRAADEPPRAARVPRLDGVLQVALTGNLDLLTARANLRATRVDAEVASNARLPLLDVGAGGGPAGISSNLGRAWSMLGHFGGYSVQGSLTFQQPTLNRAARGNYVSARAAVGKADLDETLVRQQVQANAVRLVAAADNAARRLTILAPSIDSANRDLEAERARFAVGRSTNFDVLRRQDEVADVQLRQLRARVDYEQAIAAVDALTGEILPRMGVKLR